MDKNASEHPTKIVKMDAAYWKAHEAFIALVWKRHPKLRRPDGWMHDEKITFCIMRAVRVMPKYHVAISDDTLQSIARVLIPEWRTNDPEGILVLCPAQ